MQQTTNYKLNLIEKTDTFSPDPLNENMETLDDTLLVAHVGAKEEARARTEADADLDQRVTALEVHHVAVGKYRGSTGPSDGSWRVFPLGFTPEAVLIQVETSHSCGLAVRDGGMDVLQIVENGFQVCNTISGANYNNQTYRYTFLALA